MGQENPFGFSQTLDDLLQSSVPISSTRILYHHGFHGYLEGDFRPNSSGPMLIHPGYFLLSMVLHLLAFDSELAAHSLLSLSIIHHTESSAIGIL